ncbi:energy transducer TonB [Chryseobacterium sp. L7]|uniref:Energy transducer TonB n=1 Tax=Chryseobacterium endalhagicum TaxID=2797638 RepID=A0ABS1QGE0_9FLAO|nr:energy transducer TonB [Chryseobacterium endalhagicum]MBL1221674.1 energy transducer TonB [Chryseobacterium endalhagicum]
MKKITVFALLFLSAAAFSQTQETVKSSQTEQTDKPAEYPGGFGGFRKAVGQKIRIDRIKGAKGRIESKAAFSINLKGEVENLVVTGENESFNKEVERAIRSIKPKWNPSTQQGTPVEAKYTIPFAVTFE